MSCIRVKSRGLWGGDSRLLTSSSLQVSGSLLSCSRSSGLPSSCASRSSKGRWRERTVTGKSRRSWPRLGWGGLKLKYRASPAGRLRRRGSRGLRAQGASAGSGSFWPKAASCRRISSASPLQQGPGLLALPQPGLQAASFSCPLFPEPLAAPQLFLQQAVLPLQ